MKKEKTITLKKKAKTSNLDVIFFMFLQTQPRNYPLSSKTPKKK